MTKRKLSWKAKRNGDIYCAPACGGGCTYAAFKLATKRAELLCKRLGPEWQPDVSENLGWHYAVKSPCGRVRVSEHWPAPGKGDLVSRVGRLVPDHYTAFLNLDGGIGGVWTATADTPEEAIRIVQSQAIDEHDRVSDVLECVDGLIAAFKS